MLSLSRDLRDTFLTAWHGLGKRRHVLGLVGEANKVLKQLAWVWATPLAVRTCGGDELDMRAVSV